MLLEIIRKNINEQDELELKVNLMILRRMLEIEDSYQKQRLERGLLDLMKCLDRYSAYWKITDILIDYIFKLCATNDLVFTAVSEEPDFLKLIDAWLSEKGNLKLMIAYDELRFWRKREDSAYYKYLSTKKVAKINALNFKGKKEKLWAITKKKRARLKLDYDSEDDFTE